MAIEELQLRLSPSLHMLTHTCPHGTHFPWADALRPHSLVTPFLILLHIKAWYLCSHATLTASGRSAFLFYFLIFIFITYICVFGCSYPWNAEEELSFSTTVVTGVCELSEAGPLQEQFGLLTPSHLQAPSLGFDGDSQHDD